MKHYNFGSITQFRNICKQIKMEAEYQGKDAEGNAIYNPNAPKPTLTFTGTVKLHGTNAAVVYSKEHGLYAQSRERVLSIESDNAGFAFYVESNRKYFENQLSKICEMYDYHVAVIYGEWAGGNIQKGVGICNQEKSFYPFLLKYFNEKGEEIEHFLPAAPVNENEECWTHLPEKKMYAITSFPTFTLDINFNHPELVQNELIRITEEVERECPVAKAFGHSGIGEGVVWTADWNGKQYRFKVKGEKHSSSKVKTLASVNTDKIESCQKFAEYAVTESRFEQALQAVFPDGNLDVKHIGALLKWMNTDIIKEEMDTLVANNLEFKEVAKYIAVATKMRFFERAF